MLVTMAMAEASKLWGIWVNWGSTTSQINFFSKKVQKDIYFFVFVKFKVCCRFPTSLKCQSTSGSMKTHKGEGKKHLAAVWLFSRDRSSSVSPTGHSRPTKSNLAFWMKRKLNFPECLVRWARWKTGLMFGKHFVFVLFSFYHKNLLNCIEVCFNLPAQVIENRKLKAFWPAVWLWQLFTEEMLNIFDTEQQV